MTDRIPLDRLAKSILRHISSQGTFDAAAIAAGIGAAEGAVRERLAAMQSSGAIRGIDLRLDPQLLGPSYEYLVSGVPSALTDRRAIDRLCGAGGVTRVFGMASAHSVAFTVRGGDQGATEGLAKDLARAAGLEQVQAVMILSTFRDQSGLQL